MKKKFLALSTQFMLFGTSLFAQKSAKNFLQNIEMEARDVAGNVVTIVQYVIGLAAAVLLIMIFIESNKAQSQSKDSLIRWFAMVIVTFVALQLIKTFVFG